MASAPKQSPHGEKVNFQVPKTHVDRLSSMRGNTPFHRKQDILKTPSGVISHQSTPVSKHKRTLSTVEGTPVFPKYLRQHAMHTPSGFLDSWDPCQTPTSPSDSIKDCLSSTHIESPPTQSAVITHLCKSPLSGLDVSVSCLVSSCLQ